MRRVYLLVEGQTEEAFVNSLLVPHYSQLGTYVIPIIVSTSVGYKGGVVSYAKIRPQVYHLCKQDSHAYVSTMFDLYALPKDFPGKSSEILRGKTSGHEKAVFLEAALEQDIQQRNFIPNLLVHEFEALLFTDINAFTLWTDDDNILQPLRRISDMMAPEDINDNPQTAPSKRILRVWRHYQKTVHGPTIAQDIGLDRIRKACPHFDAWLQKLEQL